MLNWNRLLSYVKGRLGLPSGFIEKTDDELKNWIILTTIPTFSQYYPDDEYVPVIQGNPIYKTDPRRSVYTFHDEEDLDVIGIKEVYFDIGNPILTGHPVLGTFSFSGFPWWSLAVFKSNLFAGSSQWNYSYKYIPPNFVQIFPEDCNSNFVVCYEREHPHDLRKIPSAMNSMFMDLAYADCAIMIGEIRSHYGDGTLNTPFGEIPLMGSQLKQEGQDMKQQLIDKFTDDTIPPIIIERGYGL